MANGFGPLLRYLHRVAAGAPGGELSDAHLLERFVRRQDEAAFAVLFQRHARMVWNVCIRILGNSHQAEDAFQSTFLVLVRKAGSVVPKERLPNWLYGVAVRVAKKARVQAAKRHSKELSDMSSEVPTDSPGGSDLGTMLDEEMERLPAKYREPLVLCYLEGLSNEEAARHLGCPEGTLSSWLTRGREKLRQRLQRRGMVLPAATLTTLLAENAASAALPSGLADSTLTLTHTFLATGQLGAAPASVAALTQGVLKDMMLIKVKIAAGVLAACLGLVGSGWALAEALAAPEEKPGLAAADQPNPAENARKADAASVTAGQLSAANFDKVFKLARLKPGEYRWVTSGIRWHENWTLARKTAAAEGKPIFLYYGGGAGPTDQLGGC